MQAEGERSRSGPKVIVIGAGFAGVGAVRRLVQGGLSDVTLVEAGERPGGRVQTVAFEGGFVELGAQFLHGESELFHFAQHQGLLRDEDEEEGEDPLPDTVLVYQDHAFHTPDGAALNPRHVTHNLKVLEELLERQMNAAKAGEEGSSDITVSVGQYLRGLYPEYKTRMMGDESIKNAMIRWLESWIVMDNAATVEDTSLPGVVRYEYHQGSGVQETRTGLWEVLLGLLKEASPPCRLLLNKPVKRVVWKDTTGLGLTNVNNNNNVPLPDQELQPPGEKRPEDSKPRTGLDEVIHSQPGTGLYDVNSAQETDFRVRVECEDGDVLVADHVIVTPSLGVLKEHPNFFMPPLPPVHREAIDSLGFGNVAKVFLLWDLEKEDQDLAGEDCCCICPGQRPDTPGRQWQQRLWGKEAEGMAMLWPEDVKLEVNSARCPQRTSEGRQWYEDLCLMEFIISYDPCLVVWIGGEGSVIIESLPVSEVKDVLYEVLIKFMGKTDLPPPSRLIRSEWHQNRYTRGAYSYLPTGVHMDRQDHLRQPLPSLQDPVLQLAGEACSSKYYTTAHGALESGQQAAGTILRHHGMLH